MLDIISILTASRALRRACDERAADRDNAEAEADARTALLKLSYGMGITIHPERSARWLGTENLARQVETAAEALAESAEGDWHQVGLVATLSLRFGAIANRMGCDIEPDGDEEAMAAVENRQAAE